MFNPSHPSRNHTPRPDSCRLPEVADAPQQEGEPAEELLYADTDLATFKVFIKRNLRPQSPPDDLLARIRTGIDRISTAE